MDQSQTLKPSLTIRFFCGWIRAYQWVSRGFARRCRFEPSCSEYMRQALLSRGMGFGLERGLLRILRCHPWHAGGFDPVPEPPLE